MRPVFLLAILFFFFLRAEAQTYSIIDGRAIKLYQEGEELNPAAGSRCHTGGVTRPPQRQAYIANRLGDPDIVLATPDLASIPVSGVLDVRRTRPLARKLGAALDLQVSKDGAALRLGR